ncbi:YdcF family protein [Herbaspirillum sp. LeCh32-8]|uniref:YdcF family protein n=1 Tax=Herbaspirillum sp. LeCh32-8 TaxID=2821356 RepID=UPI001AE25D6A|nr:YdcF family protein [Herbaspirillum sp. LeCh32-8]MBP0596494.1 YdcF family protein [Herbaspirillum sp. LeCh32-8]
MNASVLLSAVAGAVLLPPLNAMLLCAAGCLLRRRWRRAGNLLIVLGAGLLLVLSTRAGALLLVRPLQDQYPALADVGRMQPQAQAIVILGEGRLPNAPEYDHADSPRPLGLKRLAYGAWLHKRTGLPILVTGGAPDGSPESEAALMARALQQHFEVRARWLEGQSDNTRENATLSAAILKPAGIERVLLVTDAIHMPRAMQAFSAAGLQPIAAPTVFTGAERTVAGNYFPRAANLQLASYAMHEWIGQLWYRLRYHGAGSRMD